jgi:hypothetical protein
MSRIVREVAAPPEALAAPAVSELFRPALDQQRQQDIADALGVARCPVCRGPLVQRIGRKGPYFQCLCQDGLFGPPVCGR